VIRRSHNFFLSLAFAVLAAGCPKSGASLPEITSFTATPDTISAGASSTLAWTVVNASQVSIDQNVGVQSGNSVVVTPTVTTKYTLTATGLGGNTTAYVIVTVGGVVAKPVITAFTASPDDVAAGSQSTLTWTVTGTVTSLTMNDGLHPVKDVTGTNSLAVTPDTVTTYTLTATNAGGSDSASRKVNVHSASLRLQYTDPTSITAKVLVVKNTTKSTNNSLVLDVKVAAMPITAFGIAMNVPLASTFTNSATNGLALDGGLSPAGLSLGSINYSAGPPPATAAAFLGGPAMPNFLGLGVAKHKLTAGDPDDTWAAGSVLFSVTIKMVGSPAVGDVFKGATVAADPTFRAAALRKDGTEAVSKADIALGDFIISL
jgi:hypothetical protein